MNKNNIVPWGVLLPKCVPDSDLTFPIEFLDVMQVLIQGAQKHGNNNWLESNGKKSSVKEMHDSMFHHLAESYGNHRVDQESGFYPLLHLACRALMLYTRYKRQLVHLTDKELTSRTVQSAAHGFTPAVVNGVVYTTKEELNKMILDTLNKE